MGDAVSKVFNLDLSNVEMDAIWNILDAAIKQLGFNGISDKIKGIFDLVVKLEAAVKNGKGWFDFKITSEEIEIVYGLIDAALRVLGVQSIKEVYYIVQKLEALFSPDEVANTAAKPA